VIADFADTVLFPARGAARHNESGRPVRPVVPAGARRDRSVEQSGDQQARAKILPDGVSPAGHTGVIVRAKENSPRSAQREPVGALNR